MKIGAAAALFLSLVAGGIVVSLLPACDWSKGTGKKGVDQNLADGSGDKRLSAKEEKELEEFKAEVDVGRSMAGRLLQAYGVYEDERLLGYVNQVGSYVASYGDYPDRRYMFNILDSDSVNAFACPGGYILITLGTIRLAHSEAELAAVLGHEITHVGKKHMFNTLKSMGDKERDSVAQDVEAKGRENVPYAQVVRKRPSAENSETGSLLARYLSGSHAAGLGLIQAAKAGMSLIMEKGLDKKLEFEADHDGVKYAIRAGYAPKGMLVFLSRLEATKKLKKKKLNTDVLEKTHPSIADRQERIKKLLAEMKADDIVGAIGKERFDEYHSKIPETVR